MASRMNMPIHHRASLPLSPRDVADLARLRESPSAIARLDLPDGDVTEAALLHAVLVVGLRAIEEATQERAYAELAEQYRGTAEGAERRAARTSQVR